MDAVLVTDGSVIVAPSGRSGGRRRPRWLLAAIGRTDGTAGAPPVTTRHGGAVRKRWEGDFVEALWAGSFAAPNNESST
jgi:hypothetical protein